MTTTPVIVIDPGHPTTPGDKGATHAGVEEVDLNLRAAVMLKEHLAPLPVAVELTHRGGGPLGLRARGELSSRKYQADLVISLHCNANRDPRVSGMMVFHKEGDGRGKDVGEHVLGVFGRGGFYVSQRGGLVERITRSIKCTKGHEAWGRAYNVLQHHEAPATLIEMGFITNPGDRRLLVQDGGLRLVCASIAKGVAYWLHKYPHQGII